MPDRWFRNGLLTLWFLGAAFLLLPVPRVEAPVSTVVLDREGRLLGATIASDEQWRFPPLERVPERYAVAVQRYEDQRFRTHPGVDPIAVIRAIRQNVQAREVVSGASTLTMQVVRIARGNRPRTLPEKVIEMGLAVRLELGSTKDEILAAYASNAPFGGNTVGLEAAAWRYFGRRPEELSWGEATALAVLPNSPALVHPGRNRDQLRAKRDRLLAALVAAGELSAEDAALARAEPLPVEPVPVPKLAPHLLGKADGRVLTTLDGALQERATEVLVRHHERLAANGVHNAAAVILDVETGEVLAWVGNVPPTVDDQHHNHVDVVTAPRSTGSLLKPFLYLAMVEDGSVLPNELVPDLPMRLGGFAPENFDHRYDGAVPAAQALARSRNVPAVWMLREYGVDRFYGLLTRLGMRTLHRPAEDYGLSLVLGGAEGTLLDLTGMYRQLAWTLNQPGKDEPIVPVHWRGPAEPAPPGVRLDPGASWLTVQALLEVNRPGTQGAWKTFSSSRKVAWKTGTSFGFRDGWAIGVDPRFAVGVWVGNADGEGRPELTGYTAAAPLLFELLELLPGGGWFAAPDPSLVEVEVCAHSGMLAGPDCAETHTERVPRTATRGRVCGYCAPIHCDADCSHRVNASCADLDGMRTEPWFVLPPSIEQYFVQRNPHHRSLPPVAAGCEDPGAVTMSLVTPREGSEVYVPVELDGTRGRVVFEAAHREADEPIWWHLDEAFVGETRDLHQLAVAPSPGEHRLVLVDRFGTRIERRFTVLDKERTQVAGRR